MAQIEAGIIIIISKIENSLLVIHSSFSISIFTMNASSTPIDFDLRWLQEADQLMEMQDEDALSASSHSEATKILEQWKTEDEEVLDDIMDVDLQTASGFLNNEEIFDPVNSCSSPVGPIEELILVGLEDVTEKIFLPAADDTSWSSDSSNSPPVFGDQYKASLQNLSESMKRSQETRMSLTLKTPKTAKYERSMSVSGVVSNTEESSSRLRAYLVNIQC